MAKLANKSAPRRFPSEFDMKHYFDVNEKYETKVCNGVVRKVPNYYYQELVADDPYVSGYINALDSIDTILPTLVNDGDRTVDELERSIQRDFIEEVKKRISLEADEIIISAIDGLSDEEHKKRMEQIFGDEFTAHLEKGIDEFDVEEGRNLLRKLIAQESLIEES